MSGAPKELQDFVHTYLYLAGEKSWNTIDRIMNASNMMNMDTVNIAAMLRTTYPFRHHLRDWETNAIRAQRILKAREGVAKTIGMLKGLPIPEDMRVWFR